MPEKPRGYQYHQDIVIGREKRKHSTNIRGALKRHGVEVKQALVKLTSTGPRSGRVYTYRGRKYQASAPGEPPAKRSGRLSSSFVYRSRPLELVIANNAKGDNGFNYPLFLEEEIDRPYFVGTIESLQSRLESDLYHLD